MGRRKKEENLQELITPEEPKVETTNLENNIHVIEELRIFVEKFPDMKIGQLLYNITPENCITMGDLIKLDATEVLKTLKILKRKRLKDEVTYGN